MYGEEKGNICALAFPINASFWRLTIYFLLHLNIHVQKTKMNHSSHDDFRIAQMRVFDFVRHIEDSILAGAEILEESENLFARIQVDSLKK